MYQIKGIDELQARVKLLEQQRAAEWKGMKSQVRDQYERLKPANLIRSAFDGLAESIDPNSDILQEGAALVSGMVVNSIMSGSKNKPLKKWLTLLVFSVASYFLAKHREEITEAIQKALKQVSEKIRPGKRQSAEDDTDEEETPSNEAPSFPEEDVDVMMP
jgi:predicted PurR-regulated permease PerM